MKKMKGELLQSAVIISRLEDELRLAKITSTPLVLNPITISHHFRYDASMHPPRTLVMVSQSPRFCVLC